MADITRYDPLSDVASLFDDLSKGFFLRPLSAPAPAGLPARVKVDVKEDDSGYIIHAEMPGVKKEDIHVAVEGREVSISAEVRKEIEEKQGERVVHGERYFGRVARSFTLAHEVDQTGASAKYSDGVLELRLPKKTAASATKLTIR